MAQLPIPLALPVNPDNDSVGINVLGIATFVISTTVKVRHRSLLLTNWSGEQSSMLLPQIESLFGKADGHFGIASLPTTGEPELLALVLG